MQVLKVNHLIDVMNITLRQPIPSPGGTPDGNEPPPVTNPPISISSPLSLLPIILGVSGGALTFIALIAVIILVLSKRRLNLLNRMTLDQEVDLPSVGYKVHKTTKLRHIQIFSLIGRGEFGDVFLGKYKKLQVACKQLTKKEFLKDFSQENQVLSRLRHPNIVRYYGCHKNEEGVYFLVMEYCDNGSLGNYVIAQKNTLGIFELTDFALQSAKGMKYLEENSIIHRDLALRNLLVNGPSPNTEIKVSDFGFSVISKQGVYTAQDKKIAAIEVLKEGTFSSKSDVWAFGVMLWELFSYGATPYENWDNADTKEKVLAGYRLSCPEGCPEVIFDLIRSCCNENPVSRPTFVDIETILQKSLPNFTPTTRTPQTSIPEIILPSKSSFYTLEEKKIYSSMKELLSNVQ